MSIHTSITCCSSQIFVLSVGDMFMSLKVLVFLSKPIINYIDLICFSA
uniref:Uncharacterized protein n=1 Tax=Arundo donax TaxID=35708 RepID=A0A0A9CRD0_ARUDO